MALQTCKFLAFGVLHESAVNFAGINAKAEGMLGMQVPLVDRGKVGPDISGSNVEVRDKL